MCFQCGPDPPETASAGDGSAAWAMDQLRVYHSDHKTGSRSLKDTAQHLLLLLKCPLSIPPPSRTIIVGEKEKWRWAGPGVFFFPFSDRQHLVLSFLFLCRMDLCDTGRYRGPSPSGSKIESSLGSHQRDWPWWGSPLRGCLFQALSLDPSRRGFFTDGKAEARQLSDMVTQSMSATPPL